MKKIVIILISFLLSFPVSAQKKIKASSPLELIYKIDRKIYGNSFSKHLKKVKEPIVDDIDRVFLADTVYVISRKDIDESSFCESIWSKKDSIEYRFHYHNQILHKGEGDFATDYILKLIKENKPLPNPSKAYNPNYDRPREPVGVRKIIRQKPDVYNYFFYKTYFDWDPAYLLQYEKDLFINKEKGR